MLIWLIAFIIAGCEFSPKSGSKLTHISTSSIANHKDGGVIVFDCIAVFDTKLAEKVSKLTSKEYFQQIGVLSKVNKDNILIWRFQQFPNQDGGNLNLTWPRKKCATKLLMIFADYRKKGEHQLSIDKLTRQVKIVFGADKIEALDQLRKVNGASTQQLNPSINTPSMNLMLEKQSEK